MKSITNLVTAPLFAVRWVDSVVWAKTYGSTGGEVGMLVWNSIWRPTERLTRTLIHAPVRNHCRTFILSC